jgi:hypothetical protein
MYKSQFAVLRKYETYMVFDGNGRQLCREYHAYGVRQMEWEGDLKIHSTKRGVKNMGMWERIQAHGAGDRTVDLGPFEPPFRAADREAVMRRAYRAFEERR